MPLQNNAQIRVAPLSSSLNSHRNTIILPRFPEDQEEITISVVTSDQQRRTACDLVNKRYMWRGYGGSHTLSSSSSHTSFVVSAGGMTVGTLTLAVDSNDGLAVDRSFRNDINMMRRVPGTSICELTKFAFDMANPSKRILAALFHVVFLYGTHRYGCTDLLIEVNPRHRRFYETMLGFERVGNVATNESVAAPSQLMRLKVDKIGHHIDALAGAAERASDRSLYPLFLEPVDAARVKRQLVSFADAAVERSHPSVSVLRASAPSHDRSVFRDRNEPMA